MERVCAQYNVAMVVKSNKDPGYIPFAEFMRVYLKDLLEYMSSLRSTLSTECYRAVTGEC